MLESDVLVDILDSKNKVDFEVVLEMEGVMVYWFTGNIADTIATLNNKDTSLPLETIIVMLGVTSPWNNPCVNVSLEIPLSGHFQ